jgi:hypothetical protein
MLNVSRTLPITLAFLFIAVALGQKTTGEIRGTIIAGKGKSGCEEHVETARNTGRQVHGSSLTINALITRFARKGRDEGIASQEPPEGRLQTKMAALLVINSFPVASHL